jgi:hypothetical protein
MVRRIFVALAALLGVGLILGGKLAWTQGFDGCFISTFEPGTEMPIYDCTYQKKGPPAPVFVGTWYSAIAK